MKPLNLILENIGPFRHEEIDFTRLGEIFLIFGSTGAGKSTIFDAITYAFYGDLCGSRKNKVADLLLLYFYATFNISFLDRNNFFSSLSTIWFK